jgi:hypothetical protein
MKYQYTPGKDVPGGSLNSSFNLSVDVLVQPSIVIAKINITVARWLIARKMVFGIFISP